MPATVDFNSMVAPNGGATFNFLEHLTMKPVEDASAVRGSHPEMF